MGLLQTDLWLLVALRVQATYQLSSIATTKNGAKVLVGQRHAHMPKKGQALSLCIRSINSLLPRQAYL